MKIWKQKGKIIALLAASFIVFAVTFFAMAESKSNNSLFLDSDQDGLTDQEEKMIGTDPFKSDTDGDGYTDGKEVESGFNPLKPAPGDKVVPAAQASPAASDVQDMTAQPADSSNASSPTIDGSTATEPADLSDASSLSQLGQTDLLGGDAINDLSSDPQNPNLTNEMIGQLLQLTKDKASSSDSFANDPTYTTDDLTQVTQNALETVDITKDLPEVKDSDMNVLPAVDDKDLSPDEIKTEQKTEIEKYLAQAAFIMASNSPFAVDQPANLQSQVNAEATNFISAFSTGNSAQVDSYASKAQAGIEQMKKVSVPFVLKDLHRSTLQLALYTLNLKDQVSLNTTDPMKSLAAASSLQAVAQKSMDIQSQFSQILSAYGIDAINFPS